MSRVVKRLIFWLAFILLGIAFLQIGPDGGVKRHKQPVECGN